MGCNLKENREPVLLSRPGSIEHNYYDSNTSLSFTSYGAPPSSIHLATSLIGDLSLPLLARAIVHWRTILDVVSYPETLCNSIDINVETADTLRDMDRASRQQS